MYRNAIYGVIILSFVLSGCATDPQHSQKIVENSAEMIQPTHENLANYSHFELMPLVISEAIQADVAKLEYAEVLRGKLSLSLNSLIDEWNQSGNASERNLSIQPELLELRVVSSGARFWAGAFSGDSSIKLKLNIIDMDTNAVIGSPVIYKASNAIAGAWSNGATDQNLVKYAADISAQYLKNNFN